MRILVISDTHGDFNALHGLILRQRAQTDLFLHLGDGERELAHVRALLPGLPLRCVRGNCDYDIRIPEHLVVDCGEVRLFLTHGHERRVKYTFEPLLSAARREGAAVALYGHTHIARYSYEEGIHLMNPGSLSQPRGGSRAGYGVVEVRGGQVLCSLAEL